jgi:hypothetical protein
MCVDEVRVRAGLREGVVTVRAAYQMQGLLERAFAFNRDEALARSLIYGHLSERCEG